MIRCQITQGYPGHGLSPEADLIQVREPGLSVRELAELVRSILTLGLKARVLVNDRLDVALATGAHGVHLKSQAISPELVRAIAPPGFVITVACHGEADVQAAAGADYAILAPIFSPRSKADTREPLGLDELRRIAKSSAVPVLALGGITAENAAECVRAGAAGVAAISLFR